MSVSWKFPYSSRRMPVLAKNVVASSQPLASQAGLKMLMNGGNAVDAAIATAIALTVVEPTSNGIGSDAFALVWDGEKLHGINGSGRSPKAWTFKQFSALKQMPETGWDTVTVPGAVDTWATLSKEFGNLPFVDLFSPSIQYARNGFMVSPITAERWKEAKDTYTAYTEFNNTFFPAGIAPLPGDLFHCESQAKTLEKIALSKSESFYRGELADKIVKHAENTGGVITAEDLAEHHSQWVSPIKIDFAEHQLYEIPPNGQGLAALITLGLLERLDIARYPVDSADSLHLQIEAMKIGFAEAHRHIADPKNMMVGVETFLNDQFLSKRANDIRMDHVSKPVSSVPVDHGTVYLTAADDNGMMVSFIQSNYWGFGSGIVIPDTGISLQNRGRGFVIEKGHPNCVEGAKRPYHTIIPGFVMKQNQPVMSFGVMGAHMQPQGHVQMMVRIFTYGQNPQTACDAPRWYVSEDSTIALEPGFLPHIFDDLIKRGHCIIDNPHMSLFGGGQLIYRMENGYCAASDPRKDGLAVGF